MLLDLPFLPVFNFDFLQQAEPASPPTFTMSSFRDLGAEG